MNAHPLIQFISVAKNNRQRRLSLEFCSRQELHCKIVFCLCVEKPSTTVIIYWCVGSLRLVKYKDSLFELSNRNLSRHLAKSLIILCMLYIFVCRLVKELKVLNLAYYIYNIAVAFKYLKKKTKAYIF